jgi:hypothetical protein
MKPARLICLWLLLFALSPLANAALPPAGKQEFQVTLEGKAIGRATWRWSADVFEESVTLELVHGGRAAQAKFRSELRRVQGGILATTEVVQGRSRHHEQARIAGRDTLMPDTRKFDADGKLLSVEREIAGLPLVLVPCVDRCDGAVEPLDLLDRLSVSSPLRIPPESAQRKLRFVISRSDGRAPILARTSDQDVAIDGERAVVTVCRGCVDRQRPTDAELDAARRPNAWLQSDAAVFRRLATRVGAESATVDSRMQRSVRLVEKELKAVRTFVGYADAVQSLKIREADCMGYAVVLAALARAQGIPARIVVGMAYADRFSGRKDVFTPHAWVQAWDGERWTSYDAALGEFDSTHIALGIGDGAPGEVAEAFGQLDRLRVEKIGVVSTD